MTEPKPYNGTKEIINYLNESGFIHHNHNFDLINKHHLISINKFIKIIAYGSLIQRVITPLNMIIQVSLMFFFVYSCAA